MVNELCVWDSTTTTTSIVKMFFYNFNTFPIFINKHILITPTFLPQFSFGGVRIEQIESENWIFQMYVSDARTPMPSLYTKALQCHPMS